MKRASESPLHIEWTPGWIRVVDVGSGKSAEADAFDELSSFFSGHRQALVGVGRSNVFLKTTRLPRAGADDLRRILGAQTAQMFPLPPDQLAFDFVQTSDQSADGCLTLVAAMRADDLRTLRAELKRAGLTATRIVPMSLGAPAVAARAGKQNALLIEREADNLSFDVVQDGIVRYSRVTNAAGNPAVEVQRTLAAAKLPDAAVIASGDVDAARSIATRDSALGLLHEAPHFNFELVEDRVIADKRRVASKMRMATLMLAAAVLLVAAIWTQQQDAQQKIVREQGRIARQMTLNKSILSTESGKASKLNDANDSLTRAFAPAQPISDMASAITDSLPAGAWLTGLTVERGKPLDIRGASKTSDDVGHFVDALSASPRFRDVKLVFANSALIGKSPVIQFDVTATGVGNLPMPSLQKAAHGPTAPAAAGGES